MSDAIIRPTDQAQPDEPDILGASVQQEIDEDHDSCRLCWAISHGGRRFVTNFQLCEMGEYVAIPALGALLPGYHLLVSKKHKGSLATLNCEELAEFELILESHLDRLKSARSSWIVFEHGATLCGTGRACCIEHLHLHIVPLALDLATELSRRTGEPQRTLFNLRDLSSVIPEDRLGYLFVRSSDGHKAIITPLAFPSQYVRQILAAKIGEPNAWNWKTHPRERYCVDTINVFKTAGLTKPLVYFAHAIDGLDKAELVEGIARVRSAFRLRASAIDLVSMYELIEGDTGSRRSYSPRALVSIEVDFLSACDVLFVDLSRANWNYVGCLMEIAYAAMKHIPVVALTAHSSIANRTWLAAHVTRFAETLDDACDMIQDLLKRPKVNARC